MSATTFLNGRVTLEAGDCLDVLRSYPDCHFDSVVTDPPYALVSIVKRFGKAGAKPTKDGDVYRADISRRMRLADRPDERAAVAKAKGVVDPPESLPLFGGDGTNAAGGGASSTAASRPTNRADRVEEVTR